MGLNGLSTEIVASICECLYPDDLPSLLSLALTSKRYHSIASPFFFRTIKFHVTNRQQLTRDVTDCSILLRNFSSFHHVRRLIVIGGRPVLPKKLVADHHPWSLIKLPVSLEEEEESGIGKPFNDLLREECLRPEAGSPSFDDNCETVYDDDEGWSRLAWLMTQLPALSQLVYKCVGQFPPCMLKVLDSKLPRCRLYLHSFRLRSLHVPNEPMDPHELDLITSPTLYRISAWYHERNGWDNLLELPSYDSQAAMAIASSMAPNLKEIFMEHFYDYRGAGGDSEDEPDPPEPWKGFVLGKNSERHPKRLASISTLSLSTRWGPMAEELLQHWARNIDFSILRVLKIEPDDGIDRDSLIFLADSCNFSSLTHLALILPADEESSFDYDDLGRFLRNLPRLSELSIRDPRRSCRGPIQTLLVSTLKKLYIRGLPLNSDDITHIQHECPLLEELEVGVRRSKGSRQETRFYEALGRLGKLRKLYLRLHVVFPPFASPLPLDPSFDEFDQRFIKTERHQYRNGHVRDWFINLAMDETLAYAILDVIRAGRDPTSSLALERLELRTYKHKSVPKFIFYGSRRPWEQRGNMFREITTRLQRDFVLERNPWSSSHPPGQFKVTEIGAAEREKRLDIYASDTRYVASSRRLYQEIFRRIWPAPVHNPEEWPWPWRSLPLQTSDDIQ